MANEVTPYWDPSNTLTGHASAALTGRRFAAISGVRVGDNPAVGVPAAGARALGVVSRDTASGAKVTLWTKGAVPVRAGAAITAGQEVQTDAAGAAIPLAAGKSLGLALDDIPNGTDGPVLLNLS